jgi:two-component system response regulator PilR (NtrC family)
MTVPWEILILSGELEDRQALSHILEAQDLEPISASTLREGIGILRNETVGLVFCDKTLPDGTYRDLLGASRTLKRKVHIVVTSRHADWDEYLEAMRLGAFDVIAVPCRPTDVEWMVIQAIRDERTRSRHTPDPTPATYREAAAGSAS